MKFVIGIGNPGKEYRNTRHNVGFQVVEKLLAEHGSRDSRWKESRHFRGLEARFNRDTVLLESALYVNNTGGTVRALDAKKEEILVVCDDVNLLFGKLRLRPSGSAGGHHGLESVIEAIDSQDFPRLRVGVGNGEMPKDLVGFVLQPFLPEEQDPLPVIVERAALVCKAWAEEGFAAAQNKLSRFNK